MAYRLAPQVESELDEIWYYIARASGSVDIADRLVDFIESGSFFLPVIPTWDVAVNTISAPGCVAFLPANMSFFIVWKATMF